MEAFGKYLLLERVAAGGMAEVFLAKPQSEIGKFLAIKRILPQYSSNQDFTDMFREEAKIAMNLSHSNIVSIFEFGMEKGQLFLVMDFVKGQNLRQVLNHLKKISKSFSVDQILFIAKEVAAGLDAAHRCLDNSTGKPLNITHRDMSPQNIMLSFDGEVKIVDFGIAKAESQMEQTRAGTIKGKFGYMSPEQAEGQEVDPRTDIFSLGIVIWELLAGDRLFTASSEAGTLKKIRECQIPSLRKLNPKVDEELERIVNKSLAKDKSLRYQTAAAFHKDLNKYLNTKFPEFSQQDFSHFIKSSYSQMFLELTNKLKEFAALKSPSQPTEDRTVVTTTGTTTSTGTETSTDYDGDSIALDLNTQSSGQVNLKDLKLEKPEPQKVNFGAGNPSTQSGLYPQRTQPRIAPHLATKSQSFDFTSAALGFLVLLAAAYLYTNHMGGHIPYLSQYLNPTPSTQVVESPVVGNRVPAPNPQVAAQPTPVAGTFEASSSALYSVHVISQPSGARIFLNDQDTNQQTPAKIRVPANKEFKIRLMKDGFDLYERLDSATQPAYTFRATLIRREPMGYVTIRVVNGGSQPKIWLNDLPFEEPLPISRFAVRANKPIVIRASNDFANTSASQQVIVGPDQHKEITLILKRAAQNRER
ncbi:MAG: serine/threonine protein kinase [Pseudobdellovibrionaceae bacterium]